MFIGGAVYSRIDKFNFSTGAFDGSIFSGGPNIIMGLAKFGPNLLACDYGTPSATNGGIYTYDANGNQSGFLSLPNGTGPSGIAVDASHDFISTGGGTAIAPLPGLISYNLDANGISTTLHFSTALGKNYHGVLTYQSSLGLRVMAGGQLGSTTILDEYDTSGNHVDQIQLDPSTVDTIDAIAVGHNGLVYALTGGPDASNEIFRFDGNQPLFLGPLGHFNLNDTALSGRIAVYTAPEPLSVAALGLGFLVLIRRRRAK
jgi:hypothetical protein